MTGVWIIAECSTSGGGVAEIVPWTVGKQKETTNANQLWEKIQNPPSHIFNDNQIWADVLERPADNDIYNTQQIWDDISDHPVDDDIFNSSQLWGAISDKPVDGEILNEFVLYAGLSDAPDDSAIYNNVQTYAEIVDLKPPTNATQNGQRGLCFDPDFGLSHDPTGPGLAGYFLSFSAGQVTTSGSAGENGTAAAIISPDGVASRWIQGHRVPCKQGDRFYILARVKLSSSSMYSNCQLYVEEYGNAATGYLIGAAKWAEETTAWQTMIFVYDVQEAQAEGFYVWVLTNAGASSGTFTIDSLDYWPITEKYTDSNINNYISDLAIGEAQIGDLEVSTAKIQNGAIKNLQVDDGAINNAKIGDAEIYGAKIKNLGVQNAHIENGAINNAKIGDAEIYGAKIGNASITNLKVKGDAIFLPAYDDWNLDPVIYDFSVPAGEIPQYNNWITFASMWFNMSGAITGQDLLVHNIKSDGLLIEVDTQISRAYLDILAYLNGVPWRYLYQTDWEARHFEGDILHPGHGMETNETYRIGDHLFWPNAGIDPARRRPIEITGAATEEPIITGDANNHFELKFRLMAMNTAGDTWVQRNCHYKWLAGKAIFAAGRSGYTP